MTQPTLEDIVSLCKRRGFVFPGSDVYGGLSGFWDYGPYGVQLKSNIMQLWWKMFVSDREDIYGIDAAILMNQKVWQASGHTETFTDPLVECSFCHSRFRADKIDLGQCPTCGKVKTFGEPRQFNMMFKTIVGPNWGSFEADDGNYFSKSSQVKITNKHGDEISSIGIIEREDYNGLMVYNKGAQSYLRPETAQGIFTNFKNIVDSFYPDIPFGLAQQGKAFRNEISPRDFLFRSREFEQMEIEYFVRPDNWQVAFDDWIAQIRKWCLAIGLPDNMVHEFEVPPEERAHYSKRTIDFQFDFPIGRDELLGLAYRTDFDLKNIERASGKSMEYKPKDGTKGFVPHVIEPSFGVERAVMAVLTAAYKEDEINGAKRIYLRLPADLAPVKVAVSPLLKNKPELVDMARKIYKELKAAIGEVVWDDNGNIGKRYRRQDEIGTPFCVTVDFESLEDKSVTLRNRDTTAQDRVNSDKLSKMLVKELKR
jgi:glycyl-tRNA synthetase